MSRNSEWDITLVASVVPLKRGRNEVDEEGFRRLVRYFLSLRDKGLEGVVVNPEAGDGYYLTREQKSKNVQVAKEELGEKLKVVAGCFGMTTAEAVDVARDAREAGADGIFVFPPAGNLEITYSWNPIKHPEVWIDMVREQDRAADLPIITHPATIFTVAYGNGLPAEFALKMCNEIPNVVGWKMTCNYTGHVSMFKALRTLSRHVSVLAAPADLLQAVFYNGMADSVLSGSLNFCAERMLPQVEAFKKSQYDRAKEIWDGGLGRLQEYTYSDYGRLHVRYKLATYLRGLIENPLMVPPMPAPSNQEKKELEGLLEAAGLPTRTSPDAPAMHLPKKRHPMP